MSNSKHTSGKWTGDVNYIVSNGTIIATMAESNINGIDEIRDNSNRIVACVNACDGIEDPEKWIPKMRLVMQEYSDELRNLREIVESLKIKNHIAVLTCAELAVAITNTEPTPVFIRATPKQNEKLKEALEKAKLLQQEYNEKKDIRREILCIKAMNGIQNPVQFMENLSIVMELENPFGGGFTALMEQTLAEEAAEVKGGRDV